MLLLFLSLPPSKIFQDSTHDSVTRWQRPSSTCSPPPLWTTAEESCPGLPARTWTGSSMCRAALPGISPEPSPGTIQLHWLPVKSCIVYKIPFLTYKSIHDLALQYLSDLLHPAHHPLYQSDSLWWQGIQCGSPQPPDLCPSRDPQCPVSGHFEPTCSQRIFTIRFKVPSKHFHNHFVFYKSLKPISTKSTTLFPKREVINLSLKEREFQL